MSLRLRRDQFRLRNLRANRLTRSIGRTLHANIHDRCSARSARQSPSRRVPQLAHAQSGPQATPEIVAAAAAAKTPVAPGPYEPTWDSIREHYTVPQWFIDAKFGITMHWGLFSVAAYHNEWYERYMYTAFSAVAHANFGPPDQFGYKDFIPLFKATDFNADDLAELVKESGAKYFMPTVEHHDGFSLWN